jgi:hypothetical protein
MSLLAKYQSTIINLQKLESKEFGIYRNTIQKSHHPRKPLLLVSAAFHYIVSFLPVPKNTSWVGWGSWRVVTERIIKKYRSLHNCTLHSRGWQIFVETLLDCGV